MANKTRRPSKEEQGLGCNRGKVVPSLQSRSERDEHNVCHALEKKQLCKGSTREQLGHVLLEMAAGNPTASGDLSTLSCQEGADLTL